jgi:CAAX prenyl protease-like protein
MNHPSWRTRLVERQRWTTFVVPFAVYMLIGALEPSPSTPGGKMLGLAIPYSWYPLLYTLKIAATLAAVAIVWPGYRELRGKGDGANLCAAPRAPFRQIGPVPFSAAAIIVGVVGAAAWIGLCQLDWERQYIFPFFERIGLGWLFPSGERPAYNPFEQLAGQPLAAGAFLCLRFLGLVAVVPLIEEFFLRGFLMRFVMQNDWWNVPFGRANKLAIVVGTAVPMLYHPGELLAAAVWFSLVTWLMLRTRNIWDCVAAHAITNLLLGIFVVATDQWRLM